MEKIMADIQRLEKKVDRVETCMETMATDIRDIKKLLMGNPMIKTDSGIIGEMFALKDKVAKLERLKDRMMVAVIVAGVFGSWGVTDLLIKLFAK